MSAESPNCGPRLAFVLPWPPTTAGQLEHYLYDRRRMNPLGNTPDDSTNDGAGGDGRAASEARMRHAVSAASRGECAREELRSAAVQLVSVLKNANEPPEQMLLQIKRILAESGLRPTYATPSSPTAPVGVEATVYRDVITWSIRHYYEDGRASESRDGDGNKAS